MREGILGVLLILSSAATVKVKLDLTYYEQLIEECEKSLPRDKTCKLIAVEERL